MQGLMAAGFAIKETILVQEIKNVDNVRGPHLQTWPSWYVVVGTTMEKTTPSKLKVGKPFEIQWVQYYGESNYAYQRVGSTAVFPACRVVRPRKKKVSLVYIPKGDRKGLGGKKSIEY